MMSIRLNNEVIKILKNQSLLHLLTEKGYTNNRYAVALNHHFVPRTQHAKTFLQENDAIEIIVPMQGG